eukprot:679976-Hanusia_phi.AAC.1
MRSPSSRSYKKGRQQQPPVNQFTTNQGPCTSTCTFPQNGHIWRSLLLAKDNEPSLSSSNFALLLCVPSRSDTDRKPAMEARRLPDTSLLVGADTVFVRGLVSPLESVPTIGNPRDAVASTRSLGFFGKKQRGRQCENHETGVSFAEMTSEEGLLGFIFNQGSFMSVPSHHAISLCERKVEAFQQVS